MGQPHWNFCSGSALLVSASGVALIFVLVFRLAAALLDEKLAFTSMDVLLCSKAESFDVFESLYGKQSLPSASVDVTYFNFHHCAKVGVVLR